MQLPDGVVMPPVQAVPSPYDRYIYGPDADNYAIPSSYLFPATSKPYEKSSHEDVNYGYSTYTPPQFSANTSEQQIYSNPYYSNSYGTQHNATAVTDSQSFTTNVNVNPNQTYEPYMNQMGSIPEASMSIASGYSAANQTEMIANFAQMQVSVTKAEEYVPDYSQTFYNAQYPNVSTPGSAAHASVPQNSNTSLATSQVHSDYTTLNYPYSSTESPQYNQQVPNYTSAEPAYSYSNTFASTSQGYTYSNAVTSTTSTINNSGNLPYSYPSEIDSNYNPAFDFDKPIKSHTTGEALTNVPFQPSYHSYSSNVPGYSKQTESYNPTSTYGYTDQTNTSYAQSYQNHPGYNFNSSTGTYEYNFGSQNSFTGYDNTVPENVNYQQPNKDQNWHQHSIYTNAGNIGTCETVQSPDNSQIVPQMPTDQPINTQIYYNNSYGYQNVTSPINEAPAAAQPPNNHQPVANTNQGGYIQNVQSPQEQALLNNSQGKLL